MSVEGVKRHNRLCASCGRRLVRNPDKPKKWIHHATGKKSCDPWPGTATVAKTVLSEDIHYVLCNGQFYRRNNVFWPDNDSRSADLWVGYRQGVPAKTIEQLFEEGEVYPVHVSERPI